MRKKYGETETQAAARYIDQCRTAAAAFPALRQVILAFDGKIYNKRFDVALQSKIDRIYTEKKTCGDDHRIGVYIYTASGECIYLLWCKLPPDKRIPAADMIQAAAEKRSEHLQAAAHMEQILPTIETRRKQIEILKKQLHAVLDDLTYTEKELFELNMRISRR